MSTDSEWFDSQPEPVRRAVTSITGNIALAFDEVWRRSAERGDIATMVTGFLDGSTQFQISRSGVLVLADKPPTGDSVPDSPAGLE